MSENEGGLTIIPSAHVSPAHFEKVEAAIAEADPKPDIVAVELDANRFDSLRTDPNQSVSIRALFRELPPSAALMATGLSLFQRHIAKKVGIPVGMSDMRVAVETAGAHNIPVALIDEDVRETFVRFNDRVSWRECIQAYLRIRRIDMAEYDIPESVLSVRGTVSKEGLEELTDGDTVEELVQLLREVFPPFIEELVDRRDRAMARRLYKLQQDGCTVIAVVGAAHAAGIQRHLQTLRQQSPEVRTHVPLRTVGHSLSSSNE